MKKSSEGPLHLYKQKAICKTLGCSNLEVDDDDFVGPMAVFEPNVAFVN